MKIILRLQNLILFKIEKYLHNFYTGKDLKFRNCSDSDIINRTVT